MILLFCSCKTTRHGKMYGVHKSSAKFWCHSLHTAIRINHIEISVFYQLYIILFIPQVKISLFPKLRFHHKPAGYRYRQA